MLPIARRSMVLRLGVLASLLNFACAPLPNAQVPIAPAAFDPVLAQKGASLAAIGNCGTCHTMPGGRPFAGGLAITTPFGTIHSTNITPDAETGIGRWSEADFQRAMQEGIRRDGEHLYPAFPYDHFTIATPDDLKAIYAFIMTREPAVAPRPVNHLPFPFNVRALLAVWKGMFFQRDSFTPDPAQSPEWNRGAYLVEGLGHCGACHTPHNRLGGEERRRRLEGWEAEGWHAPALDATSPAPSAWTIDQLVRYLRTGRDEQHGMAAGPMVPVVQDLAGVPESDVRAMAVYLASLNASARQDAQRKTQDAGSFAERQEFPAVALLAASDNPAPGSPQSEGAVIFAGACATCHYRGAGLRAAKPVELALTTSVNAPDPRNVIHIVMDGLWPASGERGEQMPGFAGELTDAQIAAVVNFLRTRFTSRDAWSDVEAQVHKIRRARHD